MPNDSRQPDLVTYFAAKSDVHLIERLSDQVFDSKRQGFAPANSVGQRR